MAQSKVGVIAQDLVDKIKHQQYQPGDYLPSEHRSEERRVGKERG